MLKKLSSFDYHRELIETLLKSSLGLISLNFLVPIIVFFLFKNHIPLDIFSIWLFTHLLLFVFRFLLRTKILEVLYKSNSTVVKVYMKLYLLLIFLSALLWGGFFIISTIYMDELNHYISLAILLGFLVVNATVLSPIFHASLLFIITMVSLMLFNLIYLGGTYEDYLISLLLLVFAFIVSSSNYTMYLLLNENIDKRNKSGQFNKLLEIKVKEAMADSDKKEALIQKQSALVQMGEMISMIAHQWRQPLGAIVAVSIDLKMQIELELEEQREAYKEYLSESLKDIDSLVQNMTNTIDDFRNFYKPNKAHSITSISTPIEKAISIVKNSFKSDGITIIENYDSRNEIDIYVNEMMQVVLNILKNSQDNFREKDFSDKTISFMCKDIDDGVLVEICDNGGGIKKDVLSKIFNPYFSTKSEKNGTGLGLYMSKVIVEEHHFGSLSVYNTYDGACFSIELNRNIKQD